MPRLTALLLALTPPAVFAQPLPVLHFPDAKIAEVYRGNWENTLAKCIVPPASAPATPPKPNVEPQRPWTVDLKPHYPGWYPGVDVKHMAAAYLACTGDLPLVLRAWELTKNNYTMPDGGIRPMTFYNNPHIAVPETTVDGSAVWYPLRMTAPIDYLLLGDLIYRYSQDKAWLQANLPALRETAAYIEGWIDPNGLLYSDSYDLDQVYREIDGVAQASAYLAFTRLAALESAAGSAGELAGHAASVAARLKEGANAQFWDESAGYYTEHLVYNNLARGAGANVTASSELDAQNAATLAVDGVYGMGIDAFGVGTGAAGKHEWASKGETAGAWLHVTLPEPAKVSIVILTNRTAPELQPGERFATGVLEFSDGSREQVRFNDQQISRAMVSFTPREVSWVKFTGTKMQGEGGANAGLAELMILPSDAPYRRVNHGMTDTNFAMLAFGVADDERAARVWGYFKAHEAAFYEVNGLHAPTWIAEKAETYGDGDLNKRAPHKDCVAMARIWRYDALMRQRMGDGEGLYRTIGYANALYDRPSGGGVGLWAERYGLGKFQPGDEAQATVPAYSEYPAVYNSTVVQQALLGIDVDAAGGITVAPCVPEQWYQQGFGAEGLQVVQGYLMGISWRAEGLSGWLSGGPGTRTLRITIPPGLRDEPLDVLIQEKPVPFQVVEGSVALELEVAPSARSTFEVRAAR